MEIRPFGKTHDGLAVEEIILDNQQLRCSILTYGATLRGLTVPGVAGPVDVVLGFDYISDYETQDKFMGAIVGRYANRIANGCFSLDHQTYQLACNDGENHLHGGPTGFFSRIWTPEACPDCPDHQDAVRLSYESADLEEGFPGHLSVSVTYRLENHTLILDYSAKTDRSTICNLTSHAYFNLNGHQDINRSAMEQILTLYSSFYTPVKPGSIPTGILDPVSGTPMDFRKPTVIGSRIDDNFPQLKLCAGYDHNWVIDGTPNTLRPAALLESPKTGICMEVQTTLPGIQFYSGNYMAGCPVGKNGALYGHRDAVCLETQFFPDTPNHSNFPSCILRPGEIWKHTTCFRFNI